jgi:hypothetical protein
MGWVDISMYQEDVPDCSRQFFRLPVQIPTGQNLEPMQLNEMIAFNGFVLGTVIAPLNDHSPPEVTYETDFPLTGRICNNVYPDGPSRSI